DGEGGRVGRAAARRKASTGRAPGPARQGGQIRPPEPGPPPQPPRLLAKRGDHLVPSRPNGVNEPPTLGELIGQRRRYLRGSGRDNDAVERSVPGEAERPVAHDHRGTLDSCDGQVAAGLLGPPGG